MNITLKNKVLLIACLTIIVPSLILALNTGQLSFVSLSAQSLEKKDTATDHKSDKEVLRDAEAQMDERNREQSIPTESEYPKKPYTAQGLIDFLNNEKFAYEYRYNATQLATQLPRDEYIRFLKSAVEVKDGEIAANAILKLLELDEQWIAPSINKRILSLPNYGQGMILIRFIQKLPTDSKYRFSSLSRQLLQQLLTSTSVSIKGQSESKSGIKLSSEMTREEALSKARHVGYACLLLVTSTPILTEDDHALLKKARKQFPKERRVWLAGSLAKDITGSDLKIGQPIYTDTREDSPLRVAVALSLAPVDTKAKQFFNASIEHLLSTASKREDAIEKNFDSAEGLGSGKLLQLIQFNVELQYIGWLRFYNGANARTLTLKCLSSKSHSVREYSWIVAAERFPEEMITVIKKDSDGANSVDRKEVEKYLALLVVFNPKYRKSVQEIVPQKTLDALMRSIEKKGIAASFKGASPYLGL